MYSPHYHAAQFASSTTAAGSGLTWFAYQVQQYGPGWAMVPPIILSMASLYGAYWSGLKMRDDLEAARLLRARELIQLEELHRARMDRIKSGSDQILDVRT